MLEFSSLHVTSQIPPGSLELTGTDLASLGIRYSDPLLVQVTSLPASPVFLCFAAAPQRAVDRTRRAVGECEENGAPPAVLTTPAPTPTEGEISAMSAEREWDKGDMRDEPLSTRDAIRAPRANLSTRLASWAVPEVGKVSEAARLQPELDSGKAGGRAIVRVLQLAAATTKKREVSPAATAAAAQWICIRRPSDRPYVRIVQACELSAQAAQSAPRNGRAKRGGNGGARGGGSRGRTGGGGPQSGSERDGRGKGSGATGSAGSAGTAQGETMLSPVARLQVVGALNGRLVCPGALIPVGSDGTEMEVCAIRPATASAVYITGATQVVCYSTPNTNHVGVWHALARTLQGELARTLQGDVAEQSHKTDPSCTRSPIPAELTTLQRSSERRPPRIVAKVTRTETPGQEEAHGSTIFRALGILPGQVEAFRILCALIGCSTCAVQRLTTRGQGPPNGVLLYGPPGCGKTHLVNVAAAVFKIPLICVDASNRSHVYGGGTMNALETPASRYDTDGLGVFRRLEVLTQCRKGSMQEPISAWSPAQMRNEGVAGSALGAGDTGGGEGAQRLRQLFLHALERSRTATKAAGRLMPSLLFIDEIDTWCPPLGEQHTTLEHIRNVATLRALMDASAKDEMEAPTLSKCRDSMGSLTSLASTNASIEKRVDEIKLELLDDVPGSQGPPGSPQGRVIVVGATNRPHAIDASLRRAGRIEWEAPLSAPTADHRRETLRTFVFESLLTCRSDAYPTDTDDAFTLPDAGTTNEAMQAAKINELVDELATSTSGFSTADLLALKREAVLCATARLAEAHRERGRRDKNTQAEIIGAECSAHSDEDYHERVVHPKRVVHPPLPSASTPSMDIQARGGTSSSIAVPKALLESDWHQALGRVTASALRYQASVERRVERLGWAAIGGLPDVKKRLERAVAWPLEHPEALRRMGIRAARGVLLHGPPGCSKTTLARAVAGATRAAFHHLSGAEVYSPYVGEAERAIRQFFDLGRATAPSILFLDEIDALVGRRDADTGGGGGGEAVQLRVLSTLLNEMDGVEPLDQVVVIGATNRIDLLDIALLRPGRFDELILVPPPDAAGRRQVLDVHTRGMPLHDDVDLGSLAATCNGWSGAEMAELCRAAAMEALRGDILAPKVERAHFEAALASNIRRARSTVSE